MNAAAPGNGRRTTQLTRTDWPRPVSVTAGSQRLERAGWNGPVPLLSLLAAGSNALAPHGRGKGRDMPRRRTTLTPAGGGTGSSNPFPSSGESTNLNAVAQDGSHINQAVCALRFFYAVILGWTEALERTIRLTMAQALVRFLADSPPVGGGGDVDEAGQHGGAR